ncbi:hypothetical protein NDU88_004620 [Pleurodeles waltl]|uniref:ribonuclease H n=1 Tax=Pleurodeles waltl TaxID=8319 RepID=A0AAV7NJZ5_PLEWA|nr:hypothetical protein NDU88_004620 [Pleurodeles waltl]
MSRKLNEAEKNYVIAEKELLAIRDAFKEWRHHLLGAKYTVTVYTDHRNLQFMSSARLLTPRQLRWMLFFAEFDFVVTFRPGKDNRKADALSRQESTTLPAVQTSRAIIAPDKVLCIIKTEDFFEDIRNSFTVEKWQAWAQADPKRSIKQGLPFYDARFMATLDELVKAITQLQSEVVSSKDLTNSLAERVSQLQNKVEKKEQSPTGVSWPATAAEKEVQLPKQYSSYEDVFDEKEAENLPPHRSYDCQIDLVPGGILPNCRVYALSEHENQHLRKYLDKFLENGFIRPSKSPTASPLFFVPKANGELRTCIDYRGLNKITIKNKYPLPLIPVLLEQVKKAKIYTKLDLRGAYHLVRMREGDEWKTAFKSRYGLFEYTIMPFGLCNAPAAFQFFLNDVLREYLDIFAIVYIDDILIYSDNENQHVQHVKKILAALRKHHLYCKLTKCEFHVTTVEFLGVILTPQGMVMAEKKVKAVSEWPIPKSVCDVQCFLGFANFYRRFINHFSQTVAPITKLLRKKEKFVWSPEADQAFSTLKEAFSTAPVLTHPDADRPFIVEADASDVAIGAVLSQ